jgi:hypothetical protein
MEIRVNQASLPRKRMVAGATIVLALGTLSAAMAWMSGLAAVSPAPTLALSAAAEEGLASAVTDACTQCAVVISTRELTTPGGGNPSAAGSGAKRYEKRYEVTVRMQDGSIRILAQARPAVWRPRERLILIGGASAGHEVNRITPIAGNAR